MALGRRPPILPTLLVLALLAFVVERLVVTDIEALEAWAREASDAADAGRVEALEALLSEDFRFGNRDRDDAIAFAVGERLRRSAKALVIRLQKIRVDGDVATADAQIFATIQDMRYRARTQLRFERGPDGWLLLEAAPLSGF